MEFRKYEFTDSQLKTALAKIQVIDEEGNASWDSTKVTAVVELGKLLKTPGTYDEDGNELTAPVYATKNSVDILWADQPLTTSFASYIVWPEPCGAHTFAGWEESYSKSYCEANPSAAYCQPPAPTEP